MANGHKTVGNGLRPIPEIGYTLATRRARNATESVPYRVSPGEVSVGNGLRPIPEIAYTLSS